MSGILFAVIVILMWQGLFGLAVDVLKIVKSYTLPSPIGIIECFIDLCSDGSMFKVIFYSLGRGVWGYAIAVVIGVLLGLLLHRKEWLRKNLKPFILGLQTLPSVCWVPFSILWFGLTTEAILFVVIMGACFSIAISVDNAIRNVPPIYIKAARTLGANESQLYRQVIFHACLPELVSGLKQGWSFAWRALMSGEVMTTSIGLGQTLIMGRDLSDINQVMLVMILIVVVGIVIDKFVFSKIEKKMLEKRGLM